MNRQDISRLEKNRGLHLKLGFVIAISMVTLAFNYTTEPPAPYEPEPEEIVYEDVVTIERTVHLKKPQLPPPVIKVTDNIIPEETEFIEELEPEPIKTTVDAPSIEKPNLKPVENPLPPVNVPLPPDPIEEKTDDIPFIVVEHMPRYGDCNDEEMSKTEKYECSSLAIMKYMSEVIRYPAMARENGIEGTVVIRFIVDEKGSLLQPEIIRDIGGGCGQEALRAVKKMQHWEPGRQRNRKVKVYFNLPVRFKLN